MRFLSELRRKAIHFGGLIIPIGYYLLPEPAGKNLLLIATLIAIALDVIRLNEPRIRTLFYYLFGKMVRDHERYSLLGSTYVLLASLICVYAFERPIAIVAIAFVQVGDAMAAVVGRAFGRLKVFDKSLEGSLACLASCIAVGLLYPGDPILQPSDPFTWSMIMGGAVMATLFELVPMPLDDNLRISLSAGFTMTLLQ
jgi:dolichol kinase